MCSVGWLVGWLVGAPMWTCAHGAPGFIYNVAAVRWWNNSVPGHQRGDAADGAAGGQPPLACAPFATLGQHCRGRWWRRYGRTARARSAHQAEACNRVVDRRSLPFRPTAPRCIGIHESRSTTQFNSQPVWICCAFAQRSRRGAANYRLCGQSFHVCFNRK